MYKIICNKEQLILIGQACEYLGRHCINQPDFKALLLEDWIDKEKRDRDGYSLTDIWKQVMYETVGDKSNSGVGVHNYDTHKMGEHKLVEIL